MTSSPDYLDAHAATQLYLTLPREYADALGNVRWSDQVDGLVLAGRKLASYEDLAEFLEGFASQRPLLAFGLMIHWATLFGAESADRQFVRLRNAFQSYRENWRNAGALAAMISYTLLPAANPPLAVLLGARLRDTAFPIRWFTGLLNGMSGAGEDPPHTLIEFEQHARAGIAVLSDDDLASWLKFGRGPVRRAGEALAGERPPPRVFGSILDELLERPRLAGAAAYLPQMVMALSVPPRRQTPEQLPMGGYADVVTHGSVDRLLPSQHALDDLEFERRFTENELLFFRREEPPAQNRQEVVVVVDQGVRTWGDVRLVLAAAALALTQHADRKKMACSLACTSQLGFFSNPLQQPDPRLGAALEASDLSVNPALALEKALEYPSTTPRDLFLLTHPRSVIEPDVQVAARRLMPKDRLFALTVNGRGEAELLQLRSGLPVRLRSFRVDFIAAATPAKIPATVASGSWTGDVEPIGWPFRFGNDSAVQFFEFDATGQHLFALMKNSMLYAWKLTGGDMEILPRPQTARGRITEWHDMVGVVGGVALLGSQDSRYVVAHYDWKQQSCKVHFTKLPIVSSCQLSFVRHCNAVALTFLSSIMQSVAIDLATGELAASESQYVVNVGNELEQISRHRRVERAISYLMAVGPATNVVAEVKSRVQLDQHLPHPAYHFSPENASLTVMACGGQWRSFVPHRDGKKSFEGARIREIRHGAANQSQQTLAIHYTASPFRDDDHFLSFFRGPAGDFLRELRWVSPKENSPRQFRLSSEGDKVAMLRSEEQIEVQYTDRPQRILFTRPRRWFSPARLWVGQDGFLLCCGKKGYAWHLVQWSTGVLQVHSQMKPSNHCRYEEFNHPRIREFVGSRDPVEATRYEVSLFNDTERWPKGLSWNGILYVVDRFGQVLVFDRESKVLFQFFAYGDSWTAWTPDGMRYGHGMVHHWPNVPGAAAAMGKKLLRATRGGSS